MRHGVVILPDERWARGADRWIHAERLGFEHAWTFDHLLWRELRTATWFSAMPTLAAAATLTSRLKLGTLVASPNLHHPLTLAKEMMTLDDISDGRAIIGLGAGAVGHDTRAFGGKDLPARARADRFAEFVELTHALVTRRDIDFAGGHFHARDMHMAPGFMREGGPALVVAAGGPRTMRAAARYGHAWVTLGEPGRFEVSRFDRGRERLQVQLDLLDRALEQEGRDPASIDRIVVAGKQLSGVLESAAAFEEAEGFFGDLGFTDMVVFWPRPIPPFEGDLAVLDEIAPRLSGSRAWA